MNRELLFRISANLQERASSGWSNLTGFEKIFYCVWQYVAEVNSGGMHRFLFYDGGDHAEETAGALFVVGATDLADGLADAAELFPDGKFPTDINSRQEIMSNWPDEKLDRLEECKRGAYDFDSETALWTFYEEHKAHFKIPKS